MTSSPRTIGRYEIQRELGRGTMGVVYEAFDPVLGRTVALKTVNPAFTTTPAESKAFERRFLDEARIAAGLSHPGIVTVHDVGRDTEAGILFIALERLPGETLAAFVARGQRMPWGESLEIVRSVAEALQHAHERGVVHRDIKPANIMLLPSGQPKVMDFGIALAEAARLTAAGQSVGTPLYMSPEAALSQQVDARTDIFSLGAVAYTLLTGHEAFEALGVFHVLRRVVEQDPPPPTSLDLTLPADVDYLMVRALAKSPGHRYAEARQLAQDIEDILHGVTPRHRAGWVPPPPAPRLGTETVPPAHLGSGVGMPTITVRPSAEELAAGHAAVLEAAGVRSRAGRWLPPRTRALLVALALAVAALVWSRHPLGSSVLPSPVRIPSVMPTSPTTPERSPSTPEPSPTLVPAPVTLPARVVVDFEHPVELAVLRLWRDGEEVLVERVKGEVWKNLAVFKLRSGVLTQVLEVPPGRHRFTVEVSWGDQQRSERILGRLRSGETYRLEVRLGRLRKQLSLSWTR